MVKGLYVHIPFCSYKCPYCDFVSITGTFPHKDYIDAIFKEARLYRDTERKIETLYLGGGTPTLLDPELIAKLIDSLDRMLDLSGVKEITVECNPETYRREEFRRIREAGVNRLSIGVQSFLEKGLKALGRKHSVEDSIRAYFEAKEAGFENVNIDLIYAYPGQKAEDMERELEVVERLKPEHLSAYMLTPYEGTPLGAQVLSGRLKLPSEEETSEIYDRLWRGLKALGYRRYEISNWAKECYECRHNMIYWRMEEFLGLGVSAWGFLNGERYGNTKNLKSYMDSVMSGRSPVSMRVKLTERDRFEEFVMLRLRLKRGLPKNMGHLIPDHLTGFFEEGGEGIGIKEEHMLLANEIIAEVLLYNSDRKFAEVGDG